MTMTTIMLMTNFDSTLNLNLNLNPDLREGRAGGLGRVAGPHAAEADDDDNDNAHDEFEFEFFEFESELKSVPEGGASPGAGASSGPTCGGGR
jgi:hypothetical protein